MGSLNLFCCIFLIVVTPCTSNLLSKINHDINRNVISYCTRILNKTHQIGCSSRRGGSFGEVKFVEDGSDIEVEVDTIFALDHVAFMNQQFMERVKTMKNVVGVVVFLDESISRIAPPPRLQNNSNLLGFSENAECLDPNTAIYSPGSQCYTKWNRFASNYATIDWPFPVVLMRGAEASRTWTALKACEKEYNSDPHADDTRCFVEISNFMSAISSSSTCFRRASLQSVVKEFDPEYHYCRFLPRTSTVIHASFSGNLTDSPRSYNSTILLVTRTDARSMFEDGAQAFQGVLLSVSVQLSIATHLLSLPEFKQDKLLNDVLFVFLDGDSYGLSGTWDFMENLLDGAIAKRTIAPIQLEHLKSVIQIGGLSQLGSTVFTTSDKKIRSAKQKEILAILDRLNRGSLTFKESKLPVLPPTASMQPIIGNRTLPHVFISDMEDAPLNDNFLDSFYDLGEVFQEKRLLDLANSIAGAIYAEAVSDSQKMPPITKNTPADFVNCLSLKGGEICDLMAPFLDAQLTKSLKAKGFPIPANSDNLSRFVSLLSVGLTGEKVADDLCSKIPNDANEYALINFNNTLTCFRSHVKTLDRRQNYWTVSDHSRQPRYVRFYRSSSFYLELITFFLGLAITLFTAVVLFILNRYFTFDVSDTVVTTPSSTSSN